MSNQSYEKQFIDSQSKMSETLKKTPTGIQNWSYGKTVNFKKAVKKCEPLLRLKPSARHEDFLKVDNALRQLEEFYR